MEPPSTTVLDVARAVMKDASMTEEDAVLHMTSGSIKLHADFLVQTDLDDEEFDRASQVLHDGTLRLVDSASFKFQTAQATQFLQILSVLKNTEGYQDIKEKVDAISAETGFFDAFEEVSALFNKTGPRPPKKIKTELKPESSPKCLSRVKLEPFASAAPAAPEIPFGTVNAADIGTAVPAVNDAPITNADKARMADNKARALSFYAELQNNKKVLNNVIVFHLSQFSDLFLIASCSLPSMCFPPTAF
jgi:hypothetical protein